MRATRGRQPAEVTSPELSVVGEGSPAAGALAVVPVDQGRERGRLPDGHDRLERQRGAVGVVLVGDADRVTDDLDRRLRQQEPIPDGASVLLLLDRKGRVL